MNVFPTIPHLFVEAVIATRWDHIAWGVAAGVPLTILFLGILTWLLDRTAGGPVEPVCEQCEEVVDEVAPYELAGPGRHSIRNVCNGCWARLMLRELDGFDEETPSFARHADEVLAAVKHADADYHPVGSCHLCAEPPDLSVLKAFDAARAPRKDETS